ncbi:6-phosphogluconolactonase [Marinilabiliaceae bacterium ANBcel2]|nr:6-phosphogluconolactonase [Marinilabiliaceae bacterium ANBcel2]
MALQIEKCKNKKKLARKFGEMLTKKSNNSNKPVTIALSGGSTPKAVFDILSTEFKDKIKWSNILLFWGDERCVPPTDSESNYRMTKEHLLDKVEIKEDQIFRVKGEDEPQKAAEQYSETILKNVEEENSLPCFDIMILGMGDDGHTASIFPDSIELWSSDKICEVATHPVTAQKRVTVTGKIINNSKEIIFWLTGVDKAKIFAEIAIKKEGYKKYPAALADRDKTLWMTDEMAAALL